MPGNPGLAEYKDNSQNTQVTEFIYKFLYKFAWCKLKVHEYIQAGQQFCLRLIFRAANILKTDSYLTHKLGVFSCWYNYHLTKTQEQI